MVAATYTANLQLTKPVPLDPSTKDVWGPLLNGGVFDLVDQLSGVLSLSAAGTGTLILTTTAGAVDQSRYRVLVLTGALTGNRTVLMPQNCARIFSILNSTTGAFTLAVGADNGSGSAAGTTVTVPRSISPIALYSDGTNVKLGDAYGLVPLKALTASTSASLDFTSVMDTSCDLFRWDFFNLVNGTDAKKLLMRVSNNNGGAWQNGAGGYIPALANISSAGFASDTTAATSLDLSTSLSNDATNGLSGWLEGANLLNATSNKQFTYHMAYLASGPIGATTFAGGYFGTNQAAVNAVQFFPEAGTFTSGTVVLSGRPKVWS